MNPKIKIVIGVIAFCSAIIGLNIYHNFKLNRSKKAGKIIEKNIEGPEFEEIITNPKWK